MLALYCWLLFAQPTQTTPPTTAEDRMQSYQQRLELEQKSQLTGLPFTSIGPKAMGARVVDVQAFKSKPDLFFAAYASGGLWRSQNHGQTWEPLFDQSASITIGDFAVDPANIDRIWLGTGEDNSSRSSYAGTGMYLSTDGGKSWAHKGLTDTHHISKIILHPSDPNTLWVAAIGHLYTNNAERGVFKTTDGGQTWEKVLFINEETGVIDMAIDPRDPNRLYAASWQRSRKAWNLAESGPHSALHISNDGGKTWSVSNQGLPAGDHMGRIGISVSQSNPEIIYLSVDNLSEVENPSKDHRPLNKRALREMSSETFLAFDDEAINGFLRGNSFHADITAESLREQFHKGEIGMKDLIDYMYDGNAALFDVEVKEAEVYRSDDRGQTWRKTHDQPILENVWSYGYYFGVVEVDPTNPETVYLMGVPFLKSTDGGKTWKHATTPNVHVDHHAMWIHPDNSNFLFLGNDGGIYFSYDGGQNWIGQNRQPVGQFYTLAYDMAQPYQVYGGLQDNGVWVGPAREQTPYSPDWEEIHSGDGAFIQVDFRDNQTVYSGYQFGHYQRLNRGTGETLYIYPRHQLKEDPYRFNWMTPFVVSRHVPDVLYMGANRVLRSLDRGETWKAISPDLTHQHEFGDVPFGTLTIIKESPHSFGTLYAGSDDGRLWVNRGNLEEWVEIGKDISQGLWVSSIEVSPHTAGTVFVTFTGYRNDDFRTLVFRSTDYGKTWTDIRGNLPDEPCNVIRQDPENENLIFLGTDLGLWVSFDGAQSWQPYQDKLPNVPVYAMEIHPREGDLLVATHGRSIFLRNLNELRQMDSETFQNEITFFEIGKLDWHAGVGSQEPWNWELEDSAEKADFVVFATQAGSAELNIHFKDHLVATIKQDLEPGFNHIQWDYQMEIQEKDGKKRRKKDKEKPALTASDYKLRKDGKKFAKAGDYKATLVFNKKQYSQNFTLK